MKPEILTAQIAAAKLHNPNLEVLPPGSFSPELTTKTMIDLLQSVYVRHGITADPDKVVKDVESGELKTWLAKKDGKFISTASLVKQKNGDVEIGRAVSLEKGNGKLLMMLAAKDHLKHGGKSPLVAEVRVAKEFGDIPSGEATQHICFELLSLVPHALAPFFAHGDPLRSESFALARDDIKSGKTITEQALAPLNNRNMKGKVLGVKVIQEKPFRIAIPNEQGQSLGKFEWDTGLEHRAGFTLFPIEATDANMPLVGALLGNPRMVLCGIDGRDGQDHKPVVLFGTIGADTRIAPSKITDSLAEPIRHDLQNIADQFTKLGHASVGTIHCWEDDWIKDRDAKIWSTHF